MVFGVASDHVCRSPDRRVVRSCLQIVPKTDIRLVVARLLFAEGRILERHVGTRLHRYLHRWWVIGRRLFFYVHLDAKHLGGTPVERFGDCRIVPRCESTAVATAGPAIFVQSKPEFQACDDDPVSPFFVVSIDKREEV